MKCPTCDSDSRVLETRVDANHVTMRQRKCLGAGGHRFKTYECLGPVFTHAKPRSVMHEKSIKQRLAIRTRDMAIASTLYLGWQVLAERHRLTKTAVYLAAKRGRKLLQEKS